MVRKTGGEVHSPDAYAEKEAQPKIGQIWRQDFERFSEPGFFKVMSIKEKSVKGEAKTFIYIRRINPETKRVTGSRNEIKEAPLIFLKKYNFVAENVEEWAPENFTGSDPEEKKEESIVENAEEAERVDQEELLLENEVKEEEQEPEEMPVAPAAEESSQDDKELTPEQQKRSELGKTLGLTPEQLLEREVLESAVDAARHNYVENIYDHEQKLARVLSILSLKRNPEPDESYKTAYQEALKNLQQFDTTHLQELLMTSVDDSEKREVSTKSYLERYNRLEAVALWAEQQEIRTIHKEAGIAEMGFGRKIAEKINHLADEYQKLSWKKKLAIGGGLVAGHMGLALVSGPAAIGLASVWLGAKVVTGTAAYKSTSKLAESGAQWAGDKAESLIAQSALNTLGKKFEEDVDKQSEYLAKLNEITQKSIAGVDKKLAAYERRSFLAKAASLTLIFGVPAGRYIGDIWGAGAAGVEVASSVDAPGGAEMVIATDTPSETPAEINENTPVSPAQPSPASVEAPSTPESPSSVAPVNETASLEAATVTEADRARGLWGIVENQLPENLDEAERNRVTASVQNLIQNKLVGLTETQIQEQYGFSSRDINLIRPGDVIKLDALVSDQELSAIINGQTVAPFEVAPTPETVVSEVADGVRPEAATEAVGDAVSSQAPTYINSSAIGFQDSPLTPEEQYWKDIRDGQGLYQDSNRFGRYDDYGSLRHDVGFSEVSEEAVSREYTYEMSRYQDLPVEHRPLWRENMTLLRDELLDINNTEFGPNYRPGNWKADDLWNSYKGNSMQDIIAFDNPRYEYDPRDNYRDWQWERTRNREIYLPEMHPEPQLDSGPDAYANHTMDVVEREYRHNISDMQREAVRQFGSVAMPIGRTENVQQYMARIATLYTRARLENPDFRLNF